MSELSETHAGPNGADPAPPPRNKRKIATSHFDGHIGRVTFSDAYGSKVVELDATKIHPSIADVVKAYGAVSILQTAYNTSDTPPEAAEAMVKRLYSGNWRPGLPRREAEPDVLTQALAHHLDKPPEYVEEVWLPAYCAKHEIEPGVARRKLRSHGVIAELIAKITAERAAKIAAAVKKAPREALDLSV